MHSVQIVKLFSGLHARNTHIDGRNVVIIAWVGVRGNISLAAALALPLPLTGGQPFPERNRLIVLTFGFIFLTLIEQGLSLIPLIHWLGAPAESILEQERQRARLEAAEAAFAHLQELVGEEGIPEVLHKHLLRTMRRR